MSSRLTEKLNALRAQNKKAFGAYIMAADPDANTTYQAVLALEKAGASFIELGVPFSDPVSDGIVIQHAHERALKNGTTLETVFELVRRVRKVSQIPILLMGYYNPILQFGLKNFAQALHTCGADAALIVDLPAEESAPLRQEFTARGLDLIFLVTPTSTPERLKWINTHATGFSYCVSVTGITGTTQLNPTSVQKTLKGLRAKLKLPILIGFGISTPEHVRALAPLADGIIVGSVIVDAMAKSSPKNVTENVAIIAKNLISVL